MYWIFLVCPFMDLAECGNWARRHLQVATEFFPEPNIFSD
jgi:hypothetical protein